MLNFWETHGKYLKQAKELASQTSCSACGHHMVVHKPQDVPVEGSIETLRIKLGECILCNCKEFTMTVEKPLESRQIHGGPWEEKP